MRTIITKALKPGQLVQLVVALVILLSSFGWSLGTVKPVQAASTIASFSKNVTTAVPAQITATEESQLQFSSAAYTAAEGQSGTQITIRRTGSAKGAITATVVLTDVTTNHDDYQFAPTFGTLDPNFVPAGSGPDDAGINGGKVNTIAVQADGKLLVGGDFLSYSGTPHTYLVRLNPDSSVDSSFNFIPPSIADHIRSTPDVGWVKIQTDGKLLVGIGYSGRFAVGYVQVLRLNSDGSLDPSFALNKVYNSFNTITFPVQVDGKFFIDYRSAAANSQPLGLVRFNSDGSPDPAFNQVWPGLDKEVNEIVAQPDGKILVSASAKGDPTQLVRLKPDGSLDPSFKYGYTHFTQGINQIVLQPDGKFLIANSVEYEDSPTEEIVRLNSDGSLDPSFKFTIPASHKIPKLVLQPDGKILIEEYTLNTFASMQLRRLNSDGSIEPSFHTTNISLTDQLDYYDHRANNITLQADGEILVGGYFRSYDNTIANDLVRLNPDGSLDTTFTQGGVGPDSYVEGITAQPDGKILITGPFTSYSGIARNGLARINPDGSLDTSFKPAQLDARGMVAVRPDGKVLVASGLGYYGETINKYLQQLNPDGSLDTSFNPGGSGPNKNVFGLAVQPDSKILIGGSFVSYNGVARNHLARLNPDGSLDPSFAPSITGPTGGENVPVIDALAIQSDGKILVGGNFSAYDGFPCNGMVRLNPDGSVDPSFYVGGKGYEGAIKIVLQADGKILVMYASDFVRDDGLSHSDLLRLNSDGSLDATVESAFNRLIVGPVYGPNYRGAYAQGDILSMAVQPDGQIIVGGDFATYGAIARERLARISTGNELNLTWADGDTSPRSFVITATDDAIIKPTETAQLGLIALQGAVATNSPSLATLTILDNDSPSKDSLTNNPEAADKTTTFRVSLNPPVVSNRPIVDTFYNYIDSFMVEKASLLAGITAFSTGRLDRTNNSTYCGTTKLLDNFPLTLVSTVKTC